MTLNLLGMYKEPVLDSTTACRNKYSAAAINVTMYDKLVHFAKKWPVQFNWAKCKQFYAMCDRTVLLSTMYPENRQEIENATL